MNDKESYNCPLCSREFVPDNGITAEEHLTRGLIAVFKEMQGINTSKPLPCPRCGYIRKGENGNPLSRHEDVYICMNCAIEETVIEASGRNPLPITQWHVVSELLKAFQD